MKSFKELRKRIKPKVRRAARRKSRKIIEHIEHEESSGNIFEDLGFEDPERERAEAMKNIGSSFDRFLHDEGILKHTKHVAKERVRKATKAMLNNNQKPNS